MLTLSLKLSEEVAEIGKEITSAQFRNKGLRVERINEEIEHAEKMLEILKKRVNA